MSLTKVQSAMIGGGTGAAFTPNTPIYENTLSITSPYTLTTGNNASSVGPIVISGSGSVTVPSGQRWVIL
jgi:hypothetical protein